MALTTVLQIACFRFLWQQLIVIVILTCFPHFQSGPRMTRAPTPSITTRDVRGAPDVVPTAFAISIFINICLTI